LKDIRFYSLHKELHSVRGMTSQWWHFISQLVTLVRSPFMTLLAQGSCNLICLMSSNFSSTNLNLCSSFRMRDYALYPYKTTAIIFAFVTLALLDCDCSRTSDTLRTIRKFRYKNYTSIFANRFEDRRRKAKRWPVEYCLFKTMFFISKLLKASCFILNLSYVLRPQFTTTPFGRRNWRSWYNSTEWACLILKV
jgi:hypothetical protein